MLLDKNGQGFTSGKKYGNTTYWRCREYEKQKKLNQEKCPARATTDGMYVTSWRLEHNHPFGDFEDENEFEDTISDQIETKGINV